MKNILMLGLMLCLSACGSGGGSGGGATPSPNPPGGGGGGSPTSGGDGQQTYYGFYSPGSNSGSITEFTNQSIVSGGSNAVLTDELALNVQTASAREMSVGVFYPKCVVGFLTYEYSAVLIQGGNTSPTAVNLKVTATGVSLQERARSTSGTPTLSDLGSPVSLTGTCVDGKLTLSSTQTVYANNRVIVFRNGSDIYVGVQDSKTVGIVTDLRSIAYKRYFHGFAGSVDPDNYMTTLSGGGLVDVDSGPGSSSFGTGGGGTTTVKQAFSMGTTSGLIRKLVSSSGGVNPSISQHVEILSSSGGTVPMIGVGSVSLGSTNNKHLVIVAGPRSVPGASASANDGSSVQRWLGTGSVMFVMEQ